MSKTAVGYYPGCSLESTARDYAESWGAVAETLDIELAEVPDWNCCGATAGHTLDHDLALNLSARNLILAATGPQPLVVPCALCFNRLKTTQSELAPGDTRLIDEIREMKGDPSSVHILELISFLTSQEMIDAITAKAVQDLGGLRPVCYYGCQGQRPPQVTGAVDYENPMGLDRLLGELGAEVVDWSFKTDCCGASHSVARPDLVHTLVAKLYRRAQQAGANCMVTGCQMCQANLDLYQTEIAEEMGSEVYLPVFYFTELIGVALGHPKAPRWLGRHMVSPRELLAGCDLPNQIWERL